MVGKPAAVGRPVVSGAAAPGEPCAGVVCEGVVSDGVGHPDRWNWSPDCWILEVWTPGRGNVGGARRSREEHAAAGGTAAEAGGRAAVGGAYDAYEVYGAPIEVGTPGAAIASR